MTAVIYARYSSDNQREESIEGQIRECTAYAEKNGITVIKHYIDRAFSAKTDNRPEFQQMIKDSGKKLFDVVLVWKFDRFARNRFDSANYKMILKKNGVHLISVMEPIAEGSQGILVETLLEGMAEYYSAELSEKVIRGQTENALKGKCTGGTGTIGYKIDEDKFYHLDPLTAPLVLEAFQRYDNDDKMVEIVNFLNDKGVRNMLGGKMTHSSVNTMLKNRRYIGELSFRDIVVPDAIPAIVPKDLFDRVQKRLAKNKRAPACGKADEEYLLTTKLFCGKCGALMFGESGTSATGRTYYYYKCANVKRRKGCNKKTVQKEWLEELVVRETMKLIQDEAVIDKIVQFSGRKRLAEQLDRTLPNGFLNMEIMLSHLGVGVAYDALDGLNVYTQCLHLRHIGVAAAVRREQADIARFFQRFAEHIQEMGGVAGQAGLGTFPDELVGGIPQLDGTRADIQRHRNIPDTVFGFRTADADCTFYDLYRSFQLGVQHHVLDAPSVLKGRFDGCVGIEGRLAVNHLRRRVSRRRTVDRWEPLNGFSYSGAISVLNTGNLCDAHTLSQHQNSLTLVFT